MTIPSHVFTTPLSPISKSTGGSFFWIHPNISDAALNLRLLKLAERTALVVRADGVDLRV